MVLENIVSFAYTVVSHSWSVATVSVKYVLLVQTLELVRRQELGVDSLLDNVEKHSEDTVAGIVVVGLLFSYAGVNPEPVSRLFSELTALGYLAFLFWRY